MIFERTMTDSLYIPYSIYFRMVICGLLGPLYLRGPEAESRTICWGFHTKGLCGVSRAVLYMVCRFWWVEVGGSIFTIQTAQINTRMDKYISSAQTR